jgi:hypothetical protein
MRIHLKAMGGTLWKVVDEGFVVLDEANPTQADNENNLTNTQAMNVIIRSLYIREYHRVCKLETAHEIWEKLIEAHEGTSTVKSAKLGFLPRPTALDHSNVPTSFPLLLSMPLGHSEPPRPFPPRRS